MNHIDAFREAMRRAGLAYDGEIIADGKLQRFRVKGDRPGSHNGWYVVHVDPPACGVFGTWKDVSAKHRWRECSDHLLSQAEREAFRHRMEQIEAERKRAEAERRDKARKVANYTLNRAKQPAANVYLQRKQVKLFGSVRQHGDKLVVPLFDAAGTLHSLQFIKPDGSKMFLTGGRVQGCFFTLAEASDGPLVITEGYATGASVHEATGYATVCAMNCGNLLAVARVLRAKWPERDFIVAADNDAFTKDKDGKPINPGVIMATEAACAIGARLVVPQFKDIANKPTDFNDLHQLEGLNTVETQIKAAAPVQETDDETFERLAKLPPTDYDRVRNQEAKRLKIRTSTLDTKVAQRRESKPAADLQGSSVDATNVEPWPDAVDGAAVLNETAAIFTRYVALPAGAADVLALWVAHTHVHTAFLHTPRLNLCSPEKGCGKTTLLDVICSLAANALRTESITPAVLFRLVEKKSPTLLLDEVDAYLAGNEELRGLLNAGHKRGACVYRCEGDSNEVRTFKAFAPAVLAGIGHLPGTLHDRSIVIRLVRAKPGEVFARFDSRRTEKETELHRKLIRWTADNRADIEQVDPSLPANAFNRLADNWRPLFAIAEVVGGDWPQRAATAFALLTKNDDTDAHGIGVALLTDIRTAFQDANAERMFSASLVKALVAMTDRPWSEAHHGRPITEPWLARRLRNFNVSSRTLRIGVDRAKGYELADFSEAFERFLP